MNLALGASGIWFFSPHIFNRISYTKSIVQISYRRFSTPLREFYSILGLGRRSHSYMLVLFTYYLRNTNHIRRIINEFSLIPRIASTPPPPPHTLVDSTRLYILVELLMKFATCKLYPTTNHEISRYYMYRSHAPSVLVI